MEATKKECILVEAAKAFTRWGFKKTSVDDIAKRAGVAKGTVYLAAESKEDLFYQVLHREVRQWVAECARTIDPRVPADELLVKLLDAAMRSLDTHPLVRDVLLGRAQEIMPDWQDRLDDLRALGHANVMEVLRIGIKQKLFRPDLDVDTVASLLQDLELATLVFHPKLATDRVALGARAFVGVDFVLNGLRVRPELHPHEHATPHAGDRREHARR
jgi:AcrR family transcriptional regulator